MKLRTQEHSFDWDPHKAKLNLRKHGVSFVDAATVFNDLLALTEPDALHSYDELRWVILGRTQCGELLAVAHTRIESPNHTTVIRLISARRVTSRERLYYQSGGHMVQEDTDMQDEYDLSDAKRGVYYVEGQILNIPVYLDPQILRYFIDAAHKQGLETQELLNEILTQEIERRESAKSA